MPGPFQLTSLAGHLVVATLCLHGGSHLLSVGVMVNLHIALLLDRIVTSLHLKHIFIDFREREVEGVKDRNMNGQRESLFASCSGNQGMCSDRWNCDLLVHHMPTLSPGARQPVYCAFVVFASFCLSHLHIRVGPGADWGRSCVLPVVGSSDVHQYSQKSVRSAQGIRTLQAL